MRRWFRPSVVLSAIAVALSVATPAAHSSPAAGPPAAAGAADLETDIFEGFVDFGPRGFTEYAGELFFGTTTGGHQAGAAAGTGTAPDGASVAPDLENRPGLYAYDGVTDLPRRVGAFQPDPSDLTVYDGKLFFSATRDGIASKLWMYDASTGALAMVPSPDYPANLTVYDGRLFFSAQDAEHGRELWAYDAATGRSSLAADIASGEASSAPGQLAGRLVVYAGRLYFSASGDTAAGTELWAFDAATGEARLAADIRPGPASSAPSWPIVYADQLYFGADDGVRGVELWSYDATEATARRVVDIRRGAASSDPGRFDSFAVYDEQLFFTAETGATGAELFRYDAATDETDLVADLLPGSPGSGPVGQVVYDGELYFFAVAAGRGGYALFSYHAESDDVAAAADVFGCPYVPATIGLYNGALYFCGTDAEHGEELWRYASRDRLAMSVHPTSPVVVGPGGGVVELRVAITNPSAQPQTVELWTSASQLPGRATTAPLFGPRTVTIQPGQTWGPVTVTQRVPASAPAGRFLYRVQAGTFPGSTLTSAGFVLTKSAGAADGAAPSTGWPAAQSAAPTAR